ncbi:S4 domain protein [Paraliobacillus sp. PM-2]|uniref:YlmH family RNA-binding protein n=1 Tax=Paraliobacillus sp. PM-2 TaxID=1462524 RepID=UPI00061C0501|nr:YlmH/Sll1252 family protein [Paraliobacillus sp. PM-2]CQR47775.1 S4 domain protein [Paraliobacillus sp. PM-2]
MEIYQHFRKEEQPFIDQVLSWKDQVEIQHRIKYSDFLDPREQQIFKSLIGNDDQFILRFFGGGEQAERQQAVLAPFYHLIDLSDFPMVLLQASYPNKFVAIKHRDVLGAFISQGLVRRKLGDIVIDDQRIQIAVSDDIASFVELNLKSIKNASIQWDRVPIEESLKSKEQWHERQATVSSLRLDVLIKEIYRVSRQTASQAINKGLIKVNFKKVEDPAFKIESGDTFSFRGKGRSKLVELLGQSKKDKWIIRYSILI